jgi:hypothetical protein
MKRPGIPLRDAPEHHFDQEKWRALIEMVGGRDRALALVSSHPSGRSSANELALELRKGFARRLWDGSIPATGSGRDSLDITNIPPSRCQGFWPDFVHDRLQNNLEKFVDVYVGGPGQLADVSSTQARGPTLAKANERPRRDRLQRGPRESFRE